MLQEGAAIFLYMKMTTASLLPLIMNMCFDFIFLIHLNFTNKNKLYKYLNKLEKNCRGFLSCASTHSWSCRVDSDLTGSADYQVIVGIIGCSQEMMKSLYCCSGCSAMYFFMYQQETRAFSFSSTRKSMAACKTGNQRKSS